jgi:crossover junction endodeoxyribonuclease RuvC
MITLGIDPGTLHTGYGFVKRVGSRIIRIDSGTIHTNADEDMPLRLLTIRDRLEEVLTACPPDRAAVEDIFFSKNASSALKLGQVRGVILVTLAARKIPIDSFPPALVKRSIVGSGRAAKGQIQRVIQAVLGLKAPPQSDEADALAVAVCASNSARFPAAPARRS